MQLITAYEPPQSLARVEPPRRAPLRVGAVQHRWHADPAEHGRRSPRASASPPARAPRSSACRS